MPRITSPSRSPVASLTVGEILKISAPCVAADAALGPDRRRHRDELEAASTVNFSAVTVGRSPVTTRRCAVRRPLRTDEAHGVADVEVELHRFPVEIVAERAAVRLGQHVARA